MNAPARLAAVLELYDRGMLCRCDEYEYVIIDSEQHGQVQKKEIVHKQTCEARFKMVELLNYEDKNG